MTDYRINLAKSITSSPEQRQKFYNGMLIYLVCCSAALVYVAYFSSRNFLDSIAMNKQRSTLVKTMASVSEFGEAFYKNPEEAFSTLNEQKQDLEILQNALGDRSHFLPVIGQLFSDMPQGVAMQGLNASATTKTLSFGLVLPFSGQDQTDPVRKQQASWNENKELMSRVISIRPVTGERRTAGGKSVFFVQFECTLK